MLSKLYIFLIAGAVAIGSTVLIWNLRYSSGFRAGEKAAEERFRRQISDNNATMNEILNRVQNQQNSKSDADILNENMTLWTR